MCELISLEVLTLSMPGQRYSKPTLTTLDVCLGVTCRLHFWQNDRGLLHATAVTRGVEWTPTKLALEVNSGAKKCFLPLQQGFELATFQS